MEYILNTFPITESEYLQLDEMFGDLAHYAAWQLWRKNAKNNHTNEVEDIAQDLRLAIIRAGSYYKRQVYLEECMSVSQKYVKDRKASKELKQLEKLWADRTKHGANKQKFGAVQEEMLEKIVKKYVPMSMRPKKDQTLRIDNKFVTYCKTITWNCQKSLGKKITREKSLRAGMVSLSEYEFLFTKD